MTTIVGRIRTGLDRLTLRGRIVALDKKSANAHKWLMTLRVGDEIRIRCMAQALRRAARAASRDFDLALAPHGLSVGQLATLAALDRDQPIQLGQLAEGLGMDRTTLNRNLAPLQRQGLVRSCSAADDARVRALALTKKGQELLASAAPDWRRAQSALLRKLPGWPLIGPALAALG